MFLSEEKAMTEYPLLSCDMTPQIKAPGRLSGWVRSIPLWVIPLTIALLLYMPKSSISVPVDGGLYLSYGLNLYNDKGYVDLNWEPIQRGRTLVPKVIALGFRVGGVSIESAFVALRLFFLLNVLVVFAIGKVVFDNKWVGLFGSLLFLTSATINDWSRLIHIDHVIPFFMALFVLLVYWGLSRRSIFILILAGCAIGLGYTTKETAIGFLPLPILAFLLIGKFRNRRNFLGIGLLFLAAALFFLGSILNSGQAGNVGSVGESAAGIGATIISNRLDRFDAVTAVSQNAYLRYLAMPATFYTDYMAPYFQLAPLMVAAWLCALFMAYRRRQSSYMYITLVALMLAPFVIFQVITAYRVRQSYVVFLLTYPVLANFLVMAPKWISRYAAAIRPSINNAYAVPLGIFVFVGSALLFQAVVETTPSGTMRSYVRQFDTIAYLLNGQQSLATTGVTGEPGLAQAGQWLLENAEPGSKIAGDPDRLRAVYFFSEGQFPAYPLFAHQFEWYLPNEKFRRYLQDSGLKKMPDPNPNSQTYTPLFFWIYGDSGNNDFAQSSLQMYIEEFLLDSLKQWDIDYLVTMQRSGPLNLYLLNSPSFEKVADFMGGSVQIFRVHTLQPTRFPLHVSDAARSLLKQIKLNAPQKYHEIFFSDFATLFGWNPEEGDSVLANSIPLAPNIGYLQLDAFRQQLISAGPDYIGDTLKRLTEKEQQQVNPWTDVFLGATYGAESAVNDQVGLRFQQSVQYYRSAMHWATKLPDIPDIVYPQIKRLKGQPEADILKTDLIDVYESLLRLDSITVQGTLNLAELYVEENQKEKAVTITKNLVDKPGIDSRALLTIASQLVNNGAPEDAMRAYYRSIEVNPSASEGYIQLARLYADKGDRAGAINVFQNAETSNPSQSWAKLGIGESLLQLIEKTTDEKKQGD